MDVDLWSRLRWPLAVAAAGAVFAVLPLIVAATAAMIAKWAGCRLDEGSVHPCKVCGVEVGERLYSMFVNFWLVFITFPIGGLIAFVALAWCIVAWLGWSD